jgi:integrase
MGRRATGTVEPLRESIRLKFTWLGARRVETLDLKPTPANIKAAERTLAKVISAIEGGVFDPTVYFPKEGQTDPATFKAFAEEWLKTLTGAKSTKRSYRSALNGTWYPEIGEKRLAEIRHSDLAKVVAAKAKTASGKTINNVLIPMREVFRAAVLDDLIAKSPAEGIKNHSHQATPPDPFDHAERDKILAHMTAKFDGQVANYFEFAFHTGMRPSEIIALKWGDVDWTHATARVQRARVDWEEKGTKTNRVRDVHLSDAAVAALKRQKAHTFLAGEEIFHNPITGRPWPDEQVQRRRYWTPTLKALGYRQRDAYQTRHTFASLALTGGINPAFISKQLGHTNAIMLFKVYGHWIDRADKGAEAKKLNAVLSTNCPRQETGT